MTQTLYVSESVKLSLGRDGYELEVKVEYNQEAIDRALKKCNLTEDEVEVKNG